MEVITETPLKTAPVPEMPVGNNASYKQDPAATSYPSAEAIGEVVKRKIDKELDGLKPNPPSVIQKIMRVAAYPVAVVTGYIWARMNAREGLEKLLSEQQHFSGDGFSLQQPSKLEGAAGEMARNLEDHEKRKADYIEKFLGKIEEPKNFTEKVKLHVRMDKNLFKTVLKTPTRRSNVVFSGLFATTAAMGLLLTLSDNKNFANIFGKDSNIDKDVALDR
jgi:hypothetical protein